MKKVNVLVLCTGNSARSQMAEAFLGKYGSEHFDVFSAGTDPKPVNPFTIEVMREAGIDLSRARSKHLREYLGILPVRYLIIVCHDADQKCPAIWPGTVARLLWPFEDPAACAGTHEQKAAKFREVRDQIEKRVLGWLETELDKI